MEYRIVFSSLLCRSIYCSNFDQVYWFGSTTPFKPGVPLISSLLQRLAWSEVVAAGPSDLHQHSFGSRQANPLASEVSLWFWLGQLQYGTQYSQFSPCQPASQMQPFDGPGNILIWNSNLNLAHINEKGAYFLSFQSNFTTYISFAFAMNSTINNIAIRVP